MSWYSSGVACFARSRTATGNTVRAVSTAITTPEPSDKATLRTCNCGVETDSVDPDRRGCQVQALTWSKLTARLSTLLELKAMKFAQHQGRILSVPSVFSHNPQTENLFMSTEMQW